MKDEHPVVTYENAAFTVMEMDDRRIEMVHVELTPPPPEESEEDGEKPRKDKDKDKSE